MEWVWYAFNKNFHGIVGCGLLYWIWAHYNHSQKRKCGISDFSVASFIEFPPKSSNLSLKSLALTALEIRITKCVHFFSFLGECFAEIARNMLFIASVLQGATKQNRWPRWTIADSRSRISSPGEALKLTLMSPQHVWYFLHASQILSDNGPHCSQSLATMRARINSRRMESIPLLRL